MCIIVVMIVVMLPMAWCLQPGPVLAHGAFYSSGLPGKPHFRAMNYFSVFKYLRRAGLSHAGDGEARLD